MSPAVQPPLPGVFFRRAEGGGRGGAGPRSLGAGFSPAAGPKGEKPGRGVWGGSGREALRGRALPFPPPSPPAAVSSPPIAKRHWRPALCSRPMGTYYSVVGGGGAGGARRGGQSGSGGGNRRRSGRPAGCAGLGSARHDPEVPHRGSGWEVCV